MRVLSFLLILLFPLFSPAQTAVTEPELPRVFPFTTETLEAGRDSANKGNVEAQYTLGYMYHYSINIERDNKKAVSWMLRAANAGDGRAMVALGRFYKQGIGVKPDFPRAVDFLNRSAQKNTPLAFYELGLLFEEGQDSSGRGVFQNLQKARELYLKAGDLGVLEGYLKVAQFYEQGIGVDRNLQSAMEYYTKVAGMAQDDTTKRQYAALLTQLYMRIGAEEKDRVKAMGWYLKAAEGGDTEAELIVARGYMNGSFGDRPDEAKAKIWFEKLAAKDNVEAIMSLAYIYANGVGVDIDYPKANELYLKAAEMGSAEAAWNLGNAYANGNGVTVDMAKSQEWFNRSTALRNRQQQ